MGSKRDALRVADFFCGAGGFSEGFRQAGFRIVFGLDNWKPAVDTHNIAHGLSDKPIDILNIETPEDIDAIVPDTEVIIGSPPCVAFSGSHKAGKADKGLGIVLIEKYLQIVAWKLNKPDSILRYWVMENVPNSAEYTKKEYTFEDLDLSGGRKVALEVPMGEMLNAADYGTPQGRVRFICGNYPVPKRTHSERESLTLKPWVKMRKILDGLYDPLDGHDNEYVTDPNYGFKIKRSELTDHYYDTTVERFEWERAKRLKEDHGYMGKMSFPEDLDRPSRTIMATRSASTREAMILGGKEDKKGEYISFRMPTIREIGCMMSYPITYPFEASNEASKYRLVGNSVCPLLAKAIANAIRQNEGLEPIEDFIPLKGNPKPTVDLTGRKRIKKEPEPRKSDAKYARHIPYLKVRGFRVELDNLKSDFEKGRVIWSSVLHQGSGKNALISEVGTKELYSVLKESDGFTGFLHDMKSTMLDRLPRSKGYQRIYCRLSDSDRLGPDETLEGIRKLIDKHYPEREYDNIWVQNNQRRIDIARDKIPIRVLVGLYATNLVVNRLS